MKSDDMKSVREQFEKWVEDNIENHSLWDAWKEAYWIGYMDRESDDKQGASVN